MTRCYIIIVEDIYIYIISAMQRLSLFHTHISARLILIFIFVTFR